MNEKEFQEKWLLEEPIYQAWGDYIVSQILNSLESNQLKIETFLKIEPKIRVKNIKSLIDKAFYREKAYTNPYDDIEDKIGLRFVVLLTDDVRILSQLITSHDSWDSIIARDYEDEKNKEPLLFSYQSMHFILRSKNEIKHKGIKIPSNIPCEVQIRTLLQHAHAELTHGTVYKKRQTTKPTVLRTIAKCMALIETTDKFFIEATKDLNADVITESQIIKKLDSIYFSKTGLQSHNQNSSLIVFYTFENLIDDKIIERILLMLDEHPYLINRIKTKYTTFNFYQQSYILFVYWLLENKKYLVVDEWPLDRKILECLATDIGISLLH
ncbi:RelA/SpoT domain-containing protein [Acinetobacter sp. ANC 5579]|uniref:GTP pyrophosphokinase n=1 Tax=Acinetobacter amyesii TaxID=2942470 RepID=UPI0020C12886|nr:RelA/SpoT domain-containing protein [Acinetobacter amyesii]MCL6235497.1 RelA/SpoT domain-containing protein [Acinetobacter amyesii]